MDFNIDISSLIDKGTALAMAYVPNVLLALLTLLFGLWIIKGISRVTKGVLDRRKMDQTVSAFLNSLLAWTLKAILFISVASMIGIKTTSFVAILGAAGLAIGLALQGSLSNFAGGVLVLIFRPYNVGDLIEAQGHLGVVKEIQIFTTVIVSPQHQRIIIPNGPLANGSIKNFTAEGALRVDLTVGVAYESDVARARKLLLEMLERDERVLADPAPMVAVSELADSSVNLAVRPHCKPEDYWDVYFDTLESAKRVLDESGITIPFPQRDVHLYKHDAQA